MMKYSRWPDGKESTFEVDSVTYECIAYCEMRGNRVAGGSLVEDVPASPSGTRAPLTCPFCGSPSPTFKCGRYNGFNVGMNIYACGTVLSLTESRVIFYSVSDVCGTLTNSDDVI